MKRTDTVVDGVVVQLGANNIIEPRSTGVVLGVALGCRTVDVQNGPDDPTETLLLCEVAIGSDVQALLSGTAPAGGGLLYPTAVGTLTATPMGEPVGSLCPKALSETTPYKDGDVVNVVLGR